mgnify:CR=1 FL=1
MPESALGELRRQLIKLLCPPLGRLGFALRCRLGPFLLGLLAEALLQRVGGMRSMLLADLGDRLFKV